MNCSQKNRSHRNLWATSLDFDAMRGYAFGTKKQFRAGEHLTGRTPIRVSMSAVKVFETIRGSFHKRRRAYALAVTLLAIGVFGQAVHAKNSDYFPKIDQTFRFSTTVKIADLADHVVVSAPATVSVARGIVPFTPPQSTRASYVPEVPARELCAQISFRPLRSPPQSS